MLSSHERNAGLYKTEQSFSRQNLNFDKWIVRKFHIRAFYKLRKFRVCCIELDLKHTSVGKFGLSEKNTKGEKFINHDWVKVSARRTSQAVRPRSPPHLLIPRSKLVTDQRGPAVPTAQLEWRWWRVMSLVRDIIATRPVRPRHVGQPKGVCPSRADVIWGGPPTSRSVVSPKASLIGPYPGGIR